MNGYLSHLHYAMSLTERAFVRSNHSNRPPRTAPAAAVAGAVTNARTPMPKCYECMARHTDRQCNTCGFAFCQSCFKKVHASRALNHHKLMPLHGGGGGGVGGGGCSVNVAPAPVHLTAAEQHTVCRQHKGNELRYYCPKCSQAMCGDCRRHGHVGHGVVSLKTEVSATMLSRSGVEMHEYVKNKFRVL